ncbi:MAG: HlyC/CorC family transporter [Bacteroidota bacterium]|jgi:putative hemolysin|nr:HlyC/CorC family transporter [Bacteroidota bacterium]
MEFTELVIYSISCILLIGFFAGTEIAFITANKLSIELQKKQGTTSGRIISKFMMNPAEFIGTSLIGINIVLVIYGLLMTELTKPLFELLPEALNKQFIHLFLDTLIATIFILVFAEFIPKAIFRAKADSALKIFSIPMYFLYLLLFPIAKLFVSISEFILKYLFNVRIKENQIIFNRVDLEVFVKQSLHGHENDNNEVNTELFENALYLVNVKIRKCMIPRNEIEAVEVNADIAKVKAQFIKTKLSKIIVYEGNIDNIIGYLHHLDLNRKPKNIREILHSIHAVPETMSAVDLMNSFTKERKSIAWVADEFGGTAGIVTMEDVLEEIFGDINDEYDVEEYVEKQLSENEFIFSGRLELDYLNEKYNFNFQSEDSETLSGYIIANHETIPKRKDRIIIDHYEFDILLVTETRIDTVKIKVLSKL